MTISRLKRRRTMPLSALIKDSTASKPKSTKCLVPEKQIEAEILFQLNRLSGCFAWKNHSVGIFDPTKKAFRRLGGNSIRGVSDILGIYRGRMLCLEVKSATGKLRPEQKLFLDRMASLGAITGVVRSWSEALALLEVNDDSKQNIPVEPCR